MTVAPTWISISDPVARWISGHESGSERERPGAPVAPAEHARGEERRRGTVVDHEQQRPHRVDHRLGGVAELDGDLVDPVAARHPVHQQVFGLPGVGVREDVVPPARVGRRR